MPRFDDRFARQNRFGPPSGFPLTSSYPGIVHHLSGPNIYAQTQTFHQRIMVGRSCHPEGFLTFYLHCACGFVTQILAHMLDSLVRVSRRVNYGHFVSFLSSHHPLPPSGAVIRDTTCCLMDERTVRRSSGSKKREEFPQHPARRSKRARQAATLKASPAQNVEADEPACSVPNAQVRTAGSTKVPLAAIGSLTAISSTF